MKQQKKKVVISVKPEKKKQDKTMVYPIYPTKQEINTAIQSWDRGGLNE